METVSIIKKHHTGQNLVIALDSGIGCDFHLLYIYHTHHRVYNIHSVTIELSLCNDMRVYTDTDVLYTVHISLIPLIAFALCLKTRYVQLKSKLDLTIS